MAGVVTLDKVLAATQAHTKRTDREIAKACGMSLRKTREALEQLLADGMVVRHKIPISYTLSEKAVLQKNVLLDPCFVRRIQRSAPSWLGALVDGTLFGNPNGRQIHRHPTLDELDQDREPSDD